MNELSFVEYLSGNGIVRNFNKSSIELGDGVEFNPPTYLGYLATHFLVEGHWLTRFQSLLIFSVSFRFQLLPSLFSNSSRKLQLFYLLARWP